MKCENYTLMCHNFMTYKILKNDHGPRLAWNDLNEWKPLIKVLMVMQYSKRQLPRFNFYPSEISSYLSYNRFDFVHFQYGTPT